MFCKKCGVAISEGSKFCLNCGTKIDTTSQPVSTIHLVCSKCNGVMTVEKERHILSCPYCGNMDLLLENDDVTIQRIRHQTYKDVELGKQKTIETIESGNQQLLREVIKKNFVQWLLSAFLAKPLFYVGVIFCVISLMFINIRPLLLFGLIMIFVGAFQHSKKRSE